MISLQVYVVVYLKGGEEPEITVFKNGEHAHQYCAAIRFRGDYKHTDEIFYMTAKVEDKFEEGENESNDQEIPF